MLVSMGLPGCDLAFEGRLVGNAPIEALIGQDREFGFGHVEPASVFGRVMPLETLGEAASFLGREGRVERGRRMRVQVVLDQYDLFGIRKIHVGQFLEHLRVIHGGVMVGDLDFAPALQRGERHEYVGHAVTLVLVVVPDRLPRLGRDRLARLDDQLFRSFVQTNEGAVEITRLLVGFQHVFHRRDKGRVGVGWNDPLPIAMGLESVFFKVRPIVLSLAFSTMFNSTTFSSSNRRLQRAKPSGAGEQARAISLASVAPSKIRGRAEFGLYLRTSVASKPSSTSCRRALPTVLTLVSNAAAISPSVQPSPASEVSAFSRMRAFVINCADRLPDLIIASSRSRSSAHNFTTYFFAPVPVPATNQLHPRPGGVATEIQKCPQVSRTRATSAPPIQGKLAATPLAAPPARGIARQASDIRTADRPSSAERLHDRRASRESDRAEQRPALPAAPR